MSLRDFLIRYMMPKVEWKQVLRNALYIFLATKLVRKLSPKHWRVRT